MSNSSNSHGNENDRSFANIFMAKIANEILKTQNRSVEKDSSMTYVGHKQRQNIRFNF